MAKKVEIAAKRAVKTMVRRVVDGMTQVLRAARKAWGDPWYMAGTEGTGKYTVLAITSRGRVGVRDLGYGRFRIRVEPLRASKAVGAVLTGGADWKQPGNGGQNRWSIVVNTTISRDVAVRLANKALGVDELVTARPPASTVSEADTTSASV